MKTIYALLLIFLIMPSAFAAGDIDTNKTCVSRSQIDAFARKFPYFRSYRGRDLCATDDPKAFRIAQALDFMDQLRFTDGNTSSGDDLAYPFIDDSWVDFFSRYITDFELMDKCDEGVIASAPEAKNRTMRFCPAFFDTSYQTLLDIVPVLMHEAWHQKDWSRFQHVVCAAGVFKNNGYGCDESVGSHGAYSITLEALAKIAGTSANVDPVARDYARSQMIFTALNHFNQVPKIERAEKPILLTRDGHVGILGSDRIQEAAVGFSVLNNAMLIKRFDHGYTVFSPSMSKVQTVSKSLRGFNDQTVGIDPIRSAYNGSDSAHKAWMIGAHFGRRMNFYITDHGIQGGCNFSDEEFNSSFVLYTISPRGEKPKAVVYDQGLDEDALGVKIMNQKGQWATLACPKDGGEPALSRWTTPKIKTPGKLMKIGEKYYTLSKEGYLLERAVDGGSSTWSQNAVTGQTQLADFNTFDWIRYLDQR